MKYGFVLFSALCVALAGCGGEQQHAENGGEAHEHHAEGHDHAEGHHHGEHGGHHEDEDKGAIGEVHAVLAPVWHADKGPERLTKACDQAQTLRDRSAAVETAPAPEGANAEEVTTAAKEMTAAADALIAACAADGRPDVEAKLGAFHDAFHKVVEKVSGKPHGEH